MEFYFYAQRQLEMFGNIFLGIFTFSCIIFFIMIYLNSRGKESKFSILAMYSSLIITVISFSVALLLSSFIPYDSAFTSEFLKTVQLYSYAVLAVLCLIAASPFIIVNITKKHTL